MKTPLIVLAAFSWLHAQIIFYALVMFACLRVVSGPTDQVLGDSRERDVSPLILVAWLVDGLGIPLVLGLSEVEPPGEWWLQLAITLFHTVVFVGILVAFKCRVALVRTRVCFAVMSLVVTAFLVVLAKQRIRLSEVAGGALVGASMWIWLRYSPVWRRWLGR